MPYAKSLLLQGETQAGQSLRSRVLMFTKKYLASAPCTMHAAVFLLQMAWCWSMMVMVSFVFFPVYISAWICKSIYVYLCTSESVVAANTHRSWSRAVPKCQDVFNTAWSMTERNSLLWSFLTDIKRNKHSYWIFWSFAKNHSCHSPSDAKYADILFFLANERCHWPPMAWK